VKLHCEHRIQLPEDAYWEVLHAPSYIEEQYRARDAAAVAKL
jgi:hypothetical protein